MPNVSITLPLQNESSAVLKLVLEPIYEVFLVQPGERVEVHGVCDSNTSNLFFTLAPNDRQLTLYAPGEITGFVDCYVTAGGVRLAPQQE